MTEFKSMPLCDIFEWLRKNDEWSKNWFDDELYPIVYDRFIKPKNINDLKKEMGLSYANEE